jgi:hypothetical protein
MKSSVLLPPLPVDTTHKMVPDQERRESTGSVDVCYPIKTSLGTTLPEEESPTASTSSESSLGMPQRWSVKSSSAAAQPWYPAAASTAATNSSSSLSSSSPYGHYYHSPLDAYSQHSRSSNSGSHATLRRFSSSSSSSRPPPQQLPAFPPLFQPSQHHHPSHEPSLFPPLPQAGYGSRWNGGSRSSISSFCSSYHDSSESSLDVSRGEFLRQSQPSFGTALPSFQDIDQDHFNHSYDYSPGWGNSSTNSSSRIPGLVQIASSGSSTTTTTTTATPRVPPGFSLGDAGMAGNQDWKGAEIVPRLWSEPVPEDARPQAYQAAPFQQSHEGMIGTSSMDGGGLMATTSSQAIRQLLKPAHAVHNASEALFYRRGSVGPGYRRGSTGPPPLHARSQSLDLTSSDAAPATTTSWSTLRLSTTSEATVARVAPEPPILPQAPTLEDFSWGGEEEEVLDDEENEFNLDLVLSRTDSSNSEYGRWHRPVPDTVVGELDPTQVPILSILHAWTKLRTVQGASMVEAWVQRMRLEYQAGNHRVPYSAKLYTMASK